MQDDMKSKSGQIPSQAVEGAFGRIFTDKKTYRPLDTVTVHIRGRDRGDKKCTVRVCDPGQRQYFESGAALNNNRGSISFRAGLTLGAHYVYLVWPGEKWHSRYVNFRLDCGTLIESGDQDFDSIYAMVPSTIAMQLALIPAILMALAIVREKELGSIVNLYVTPVTRLEFLLGKQLPYVAVATINFALLFVMALVVFGVPLKGSFLTLLFGTVIYVTTTTGYGMLISAFTRTQIAALFGTAILTVLPATMFAGMLTPVSSLTGAGSFIGRLFPMSYYVPISVGTFTKGLGFADLSGYILALLLFIPVMTGLSLLLLPKQER